MGKFKFYFSFILAQMFDWNTAIAANVPSIGEGADFRVENSIQAVQPLFCLYCVISWCGIVAQNLNRRTNLFSFLFCAVGK